MRNFGVPTLAVLFIAVSSFAADDVPAGAGLLGGAEIFGIDRSHSYFGFSIGFLGLSHVRGTLRDYSATIVYDEAHPERTSVTAVIDPASIDTSNETRDKDLKGANFFDVQTYPQIVFQSTRVERKGGEQFVVHGNLTIKGVAREVMIPMARTVHRGPDAAWGNIRIGGRGAVVVRRKDFNILGNDFWGDKTLADDVEVTLEILGNRFNYERFNFNSEGKPSIGEVALKSV